tara:strand:- start:443 stop:598 length:156 start_codon:yes stop_codon:yes gene_type:complete
VVSKQELDSVIEQVNESYSAMEKRILRLEEALAAKDCCGSKAVKKERLKKT